MESTVTQVETIREREVFGEISRFLSTGNIAGLAFVPRALESDRNILNKVEKASTI